MPTIASYSRLGGAHAETATVTNTLRAQGVRAPHTGEAYTEAMILGIAGGLGAGYILWEFKEHSTKTLVFGFQNKWNYPQKFLDGLFSRINVKPTHFQGGAKGGAKALDKAIKEGKPGIVWVDQYHLPYYGLPSSMDGSIGQLVTVFGIEGSEVLIDDMANKPFRLTLNQLAAARGRISSYKNHLLTLEPGKTPKLEKAIVEGIQDCIGNLSSDSESFSLPVYKKWAKMMLDTRNAKGWPNVFADGKSLFPALCSVYENIELYSTGGGGMRGLYADFLDEAAGVLNNLRLSEAAEKYRDLAVTWTNFASDALVVTPALREARELLRRKYALLKEKGGVAYVDTAPINERLELFRKKYKERPPLEPREQAALFAHMSEGLLKIYNGETAALEALKRAIA